MCCKRVCMSVLLRAESAHVYRGVVRASNYSKAPGKLPVAVRGTPFLSNGTVFVSCPAGVGKGVSQLGKARRAAGFHAAVRAALPLVERVIAVESL